MHRVYRKPGDPRGYVHPVSLSTVGFIDFPRGNCTLPGNLPDHLQKATG